MSFPWFCQSNLVTNRCFFPPKTSFFLTLFKLCLFIAAKQSICRPTNSACVLCIKKNNDSLRGRKTCFNTSYLCKKSKAKSKEAKPVACVSFKDLIKTYYFIDIDDDNRLQHSTVMCSSCRKRLERCQNGQKQNQDLQTDLAFLGIHLV